jgi:hypothetical protein
VTAGSLDVANNKSGAGTLSMDSAGCHLMAPSYEIDTNISSTAKLDAGPLLMVMDFVSPDLSVDAELGMLFGCDDTGCVQYDLWTTTPEVEVWQDSDNQPIASKKQAVDQGTNRMVAVLQGQQVRVWFNGTLVETLQVTRAHDAGTYKFFEEDLSKTGPSSAILLQLGVYTLKQ